jgi:RNA-directed DNA polymerase
MDKTKPFCISKKSLMTAWKRVKANKGSHSLDEESCEDFESKLKDNHNYSRG